MQPTLTQVPPKYRSSTMATRAPYCAATRLARTPPEPAADRDEIEIVFSCHVGHLEVLVHLLANTKESRQVGDSPCLRGRFRDHLYQRFRIALLLRACLTLSCRMLRPGHFVVDDFLKLIRRLRTADLAAINEKGGSTGYAELGAFGHVLLNLRLIFGLV